MPCAGVLQDVIRALFDFLDTDKSGTLDSKEIGRLANFMGQDMSGQQVDEAISLMKYSDGHIGDQDAEKKTEHKGYGVADDGKVSCNEFLGWWKTWKGDVTQAELSDLLTQVDNDHSGAVDLHEFIETIAQKMVTELPLASLRHRHRRR